MPIIGGSIVPVSDKPRPLYFGSTRLDDALAAYFRERLHSGHGLGEPDCYRGLDPESRLFLSPGGEPYKIAPNNGAPGQNRYVCRALLEIYRKLFRYAELKGLRSAVRGSRCGHRPPGPPCPGGTHPRPPRIHL